jgi:hypothetical protein
MHLPRGVAVVAEEARIHEHLAAAERHDTDRQSACPCAALGTPSWRKPGRLRAAVEAEVIGIGRPLASGDV